MLKSKKLMMGLLGVMAVVTTRPTNVYAQVQGGIERPDRRAEEPRRPEEPRHGGGGGRRPDPRPDPGPYRPGPERPDPRPEPGPYRPDPYRPDPYRPEPHYPYYPGQRTAEIQRNVIEETLSVDRLLGLSRREVDEELSSVGVQFRRPYRAAVVELLVNGYVVTSQTVYDGTDVELLLPSRAGDWRDRGTVDIRVRGALYIERISGNLSGRSDGGYDYGRREETINIYVGRSTFRNDRIELSSSLNRFLLDGYEITQVSVDAQDRTGYGDLGMAIDGYLVSSSVPVSRYGETLISLNRNSRLSRYTRSVELLTRGDLYIRMVTVRLRR